MTGSIRLPIRFRHSSSIAALLSLPLLGLGDLGAAGPTVAELLALCDRGLAQGNTGRDAAACEWFAAPCACNKRVAGTGEPRWCVPESGGIEDTVQKVLGELRRYPNPAADVGLVVPEILERLYPCGSGDGSASRKTANAVREDGEPMQSASGRRIIGRQDQPGRSGP